LLCFCTASVSRWIKIYINGRTSPNRFVTVRSHVTHGRFLWRRVDSTLSRAVAGRCGRGANQKAVDRGVWFIQLKRSRLHACMRRAWLPNDRFSLTADNNRINLPTPRQLHWRLRWCSRSSTLRITHILTGIVSNSRNTIIKQSPVEWQSAPENCTVYFVFASSVNMLSLLHSNIVSTATHLQFLSHKQPTSYAEMEERIGSSINRWQVR